MALLFQSPDVGALDDRPCLRSWASSPTRRFSPLYVGALDHGEFEVSVVCNRPEGFSPRYVGVLDDGDKSRRQQQSVAGFSPLYVGARMMAERPW